MMENQPPPLSRFQQQERLRRIVRIARSLGFVGRVEYHHLYSNSGGAQFVPGSSQEEDVLRVFVEAFVRDANPEDFSLEAILAHERGHQILLRNHRLQRLIWFTMSKSTEEFLASLIGSILVSQSTDQDSLLKKAVYEMDKHGLEPEKSKIRAQVLRSYLEKIL